jgi:hypothetical protein
MLEEGGIYATRASWGRWTFVRVLRITEGVVHLRFYNRKSWRTPSMAAFARDDWSFGHVPMSADSVTRWKLAYVGNVKVDEEELTGFRIWMQDGGAGAFS